MKIVENELTALQIIRGRFTETPTEICGSELRTRIASVECVRNRLRETATELTKHLDLLRRRERYSRDLPENATKRPALPSLKSVLAGASTNTEPSTAPNLTVDSKLDEATHRRVHSEAVAAGVAYWVEEEFEAEHGPDAIWTWSGPTDTPTYPCPTWWSTP